MGFPAIQLRSGMVIEFENDIWSVVSAERKALGRKAGFVQAKLRNVKAGHQKDVKFASTDSLERAHLSMRPMQFLYNDAEGYHFMDNTNYDQITLSEETLGENIAYLKPELVVDVTSLENEPIGISLPQKMEFEIIEAEPNLKNATASAVLKNAKIDNGISVKVPQFIEVGERIIINTETGEYVERAKK